MALVALSSILTWAVTGSSAGETPGELAAGDGVIVPLPRVVEPPADIARELVTLQEIVRDAHERLDANTVRALERNLAVIEQAIEDSQRALAQDPGNDFLREHLRRVYRRKAEYLRDAARVVQRTS